VHGSRVFPDLQASQSWVPFSQPHFTRDLFITSSLCAQSLTHHRQRAKMKSTVLGANTTLSVLTSDQYAATPLRPSLDIARNSLFLNILRVSLLLSTS